MSGAAPARVLGIAGVGLIGASIGFGARRLGWEVTGWDRSPEHLAEARKRGAVDRPVASLRALADSADILVLAAPPGATLQHLAELTGGGVQRAGLVIDVASVKEPIARAAAGLANFVGTHPLAGSERSGPGAARADLFMGRVWTYDAAAEAACAGRACELIAALGARPLPIDNAEHDRIVASTSHVPQLLSVALGARLAAYLDARPDAAALCGSGVRSMLRLGTSSWELWRSILGLNASPVAQELRRLVDVLTLVAAELDEGHFDGIGEQFSAAAAVVARLGEGGAPAGDVDRSKNASNER